MSPLARVVSALVLSISALVALPAAAQTSTPPDVVRLDDGTFLRGTIVERSPTQVIILLPNGESRTYPAERVEFAGPDVPAGPALVQQPVQPVVQTAPSRPLARLRVRSAQESLSLQQLQGSATASVWTGNGMGVVRIDQFSILCNAPCDVEVPEGTYQLGIAHGTGSAQRAGAPMDLRGDMTLDLAYNDRSLTRVGGWLTLGFGAGGGAAMIMAGLLAFRSPDCSPSGYCPMEPNLPMVIAGGVVTLASVIVGLIFALMNDAPSIEIGAEGVRF